MLTRQKKDRGKRPCLLLMMMSYVLNKLARLLGNFRSGFTLLSVLISFDSGYLGTFASRCWNDTVSLTDVVLTYVIYYIFVASPPWELGSVKIALRAHR
jgi:hypothetical protein